MEDTVSVISVRDSFQPELDRSEERHEEWEEEFSVGQDEAESAHDKEEDLNEHGENRPVHELVKDDLSSAMSEGAVLEEQIGQSKDVLHLDVCLRQDVRLLVECDQSDRHVSLVDGELVCLRANDADYGSRLASVGELPNSSHKHDLLVGIDRRANTQAAQTAQREE